MRPAQAFAARLGLPIHDQGLLEQALVHASWLHEHPEDAPGHNERLEFLGDAVVNLIISEALYTRHPDDDEGDLSARRAAIVSTSGLARLAGRIDLGSALLLGEGESRRSGRRRPIAAGLVVRGARRRALPGPRVRPGPGLARGPRRARAVADPPILAPQESEESLAGIHTTAYRRPARRITWSTLTGPDHEQIVPDRGQRRRRRPRRRRGSVASDRRDRGRRGGRGAAAGHRPARSRSSA